MTEDIINKHLYDFSDQEVDPKYLQFKNQITLTHTKPLDYYQTNQIFGKLEVNKLQQRYCKLCKLNADTFQINDHIAKHQHRSNSNKLVFKYYKLKEKIQRLDSQQKFDWNYEEVNNIILKNNITIEQWFWRNFKHRIQNKLFVFIKQYHGQELCHLYEFLYYHKIQKVKSKHLIAYVDSQSNHHIRLAALTAFRKEHKLQFTNEQIMKFYQIGQKQKQKIKKDKQLSEQQMFIYTFQLINELFEDGFIEMAFFMTIMIVYKADMLDLVKLKRENVIFKDNQFQIYMNETLIIKLAFEQKFKNFILENIEKNSQQQWFFETLNNYSQLRRIYKRLTKQISEASSDNNYKWFLKFVNFIDMKRIQLEYFLDKQAVQTIQNS